MRFSGFVLTIRMRAKITAYNYKKEDANGCSDFSMNVYWGADYKNVFYFCGDLLRSTFSDSVETVIDANGQSKRTKNVSIQKFITNTLAISPLLAFLKTIDKHDVKQIEYLDTGEVFDITNIDIEDQGDEFTPVQKVNITFENQPITNNNDTVFVNTEAKLAYWDNNNDGTKDIDGDAQFQTATPSDLFFETWQLYYEADGVTPTASGDVVLRVFAESQLSTPSNKIESLVGVFTGGFGELFSDSTNWQSTQNIWDYFNVADSVGHTNTVRFDKQAFAEDNGYFSDESEDRAVSLRFELSIEGSSFEATTLALVYTVWGAFHSARVYDPSNQKYGVTTIGKDDQKNTLSTLSDVKVALPSGASSNITASVLESFDTFSNTYVIGTTSSGEYGYSGVITTPSGYVGTNYRGSYDVANFYLALDGTKAVEQSLNVLNFTTGTTPYLITLDYLYSRDTGSGGFPELGSVAALGNAEILLNGVVISNPPIGPATTALTAFQDFTLTNTDVNTITFRVPTTANYEIFTEFQLQLKPLF